jgi:NAD(P)-dependent dehydrogenase (short-subunit alcohol dehydrogenase family)
MPTGHQIFAGQSVVVTGAASGLGRSYALLLARLGASVVVNDLGTSPSGLGSSPTAAQAVVDQITSAGGRAVASTESVSTTEGGGSIIETALEAFGRVDAVINNAGILRSAPFDETTDENLDAIIDVHLKGAFHVTRPAFRVMKAQGYGRILFTASSGGVFGSEGNAAYGSAKTGLIGLMHVTSIEGAPHGIRSNILMPASTTRLAAEGEVSYLDRIQAAIGAMPERLTAMDPDFVAPLAAYLVSSDCTSTHAIYTAVLGRFARVFLGLGPGWFGPPDQPPDVREVGRHFAEIEATTPFTIPQHLAEEFEEMAARRAGKTYST